MTPVPVPAAAVSQLLPFVQRWREAEMALQDAVGLVLAAMGAPAGAVIKLEPDNTMLVVASDATKIAAPGTFGITPRQVYADTEGTE